MKFYIQLTISILFLFGTISNAQDSLNMRVMANIGDPGDEYNDCWGYTWAEKEFAVVGSEKHVNIFDVTDCGNPIMVHQWEIGGNVVWRDFKDYKGYIYAVCDYCPHGLLTIDKDTFGHYQSTADFTRSHNIFIDKQSGRLYAAGTNSNSEGLWVYDLTQNPKEPELLAEIDFSDIEGELPGSGWYVHDLYVRNDTAYCSHGYRGHAYWDMTDLSDVTLLDRFDDSGYNHSSWPHDDLGYEYVAREVPNGTVMQVYDISDITDVSVIDTFSHTIHSPTNTITRSTPHNPYFHLDRLFVSNYHDGLKVFDLSDPESPEILAYYDTYNTNNGFYGNGVNGSYEGCWGTYPYLPSGCILANDIRYGFYTLKLLVAPTRDAIIENTSIIVDTPGASIYFATDDSRIWRLWMGGSGTIVKSTAAIAPTNTMELVNSNLKLKSPGSGVYIRNNAGDYYLLAISNLGVLTATFTDVGDLPSTSVRLETEEIYLSQYSAGIKFTSPDGTCHMMRIASNGSNEVIDCD